MSVGLKPSQADVFTLAQTIFGEARGEGQQGRVAVGFVVRNRACRARLYLAQHTDKKRHPQFGDGSVASAARMPKQFTCWNVDDPNRTLLKPTMAEMWDQPNWPLCLYAAMAVLLDMEEDPTQGSKHYYADNKKPAPDWSNGLRPICAIGHHRFFNNVP